MSSNETLNKLKVDLAEEAVNDLEKPILGILWNFREKLSPILTELELNDDASEYYEDQILNDATSLFQAKLANRISTLLRGLH